MTLQEQARALGDPTRHAIFRLLAEADGPLGVADINERFELNHNAIRQHLAVLVGAGLVVESTGTSSGRGRPRLRYELAPAVWGRWGTVGPYQRLAGLLLEVVRTGLEPEEVGRRAAEDLRPPVPTADPVADLGSAMARQTFDPEIVETRTGFDIVLHHCPFADVALTDRSTVCSLHLGLADGLVAGRGVAVRELVAHDPRRAGCRIRLEPGCGGPATGTGRDRLVLRKLDGTAAGPAPA